MIKDLKILMAASLTGTESWEVKYKLTTDSVWLDVLSTSNPIIIPGVDDELCYDFSIRKKCENGYFGQPVTGTFGTCDTDEGNTVDWEFLSDEGSLTILHNPGVVVEVNEVDEGQFMYEEPDEITATVTAGLDFTCTRLRVEIIPDGGVIYDSSGVGPRSFTFETINGKKYKITAYAHNCS